MTAFNKLFVLSRETAIIRPLSCDDEVFNPLEGTSDSNRSRPDLFVE